MTERDTLFALLRAQEIALTHILGVVLTGADDPGADARQLLLDMLRQFTTDPGLEAIAPAARADAERLLVATLERVATNAGGYAAAVRRYRN